MRESRVAGVDISKVIRILAVVTPRLVKAGGVSQEELAKAAGVDETSIADWEAGKAKPMRRSRERLEEFFRGQRMEK